MNTPHVSIVMTYYERSEQLRNTLASFDYHGYGSDVEVIIVDDGSISEPASSVIGTSNFQIKLIYLDPRKKWYKNSCIPFNIGINAALGDIVIIQNAECFHYHNVVRHAIANLDDQSYLTYGCYSINKGHWDSLRKLPGFAQQRAAIIFSDFAAKFDGDSGWYNHSVIRPKAYHFCSAIKRKNLLALNGFDERYAQGRGYDDNELLYRIASGRFKIFIIDDCLVVHQWHYTRGSVPAKYDRYMYRNKLLYDRVTRRGHSYKVFNTLFGLTCKLYAERIFFDTLQAIEKRARRLSRWCRRIAGSISRFLALSIYQRLLPIPEWRDIPIVINNRNRLTTTREMVDWLLRIGCRKIMILDNDSSYPELLEWYKSISASGKTRITFLGRNEGPYAFWDSALYKQIKWGYYVYTDSDLVPDVGLPSDFLLMMLKTLRKYRQIQKVGFGLRYDDIPDFFKYKERVIETEQRYWRKSTSDSSFFYAPIDTTFALYAPFQRGGAKLAALRTAPPYLLRHAPWYIDSERLTVEEKYYQEHANNFSSYNGNFNTKRLLSI